MFPGTPVLPPGRDTDTRLTVFYSDAAKLLRSSCSAATESPHHLQSLEEGPPQDWLAQGHLGAQLRKPFETAQNTITSALTSTFVSRSLDVFIFVVVIELAAL